MTNLTERIKQIVREETGQEAQPGGQLDTRLDELQAQIDELKADFETVAGQGESRPGQ